MSTEVGDNVTAEKPSTGNGIVRQAPPPENKKNPREAISGGADSPLGVGKKAFITTLVAIMLNPVSVVVGYLLTSSLQRPQLGVEYISKTFYHESELPPDRLLKPLLAHNRLSSQLHGELAAAARTSQQPPCTGWLKGGPLEGECLEAVRQAASGLMTTLILERDATKKNIDRIKNGTVDKLGIQPMPLIRPELIALDPDKLAPVLRGELADCETMLTLLRPFLEELQRALASPLPTGDVGLDVGVMNSGASDGVVKSVATLRFGNHKPLPVYAEGYTVVKAHSFEQITFTLGTEENDIEALDTWKKAVKAEGDLPFELELRSGTKSFFGKGNLKDPETGDQGPPKKTK